MSFHSLPGVSADPSVTLKPWLVLECNDGQRYIMGYRVEDLEGRVSTPVVEFDRSTMTARTRSGRLYRLEGPPGLDADALYVWQRYASINQLKVTRDATADYYKGWEGIARIVDSRGEMVAAAINAANTHESKVQTIGLAPPAPVEGSSQSTTRSADKAAKRPPSRKPRKRDQ